MPGIADRPNIQPQPFKQDSSANSNNANTISDLPESLIPPPPRQMASSPTSTVQPPSALEQEILDEYTLLLSNLNKVCCQPRSILFTTLSPSFPPPPCPLNLRLMKTLIPIVCSESFPLSLMPWLIGPPQKFSMGCACWRGRRVWCSRC